MKLKGISEKGFSRLARAVKGQEDKEYVNIDLAFAGELDDVLMYGEGGNKNKLQWHLKRQKAEWTDEGWIIPGDLIIRNFGYTRLPLIKSINGEFDCGYNQLTSLEGCPQEVGGDFGCYHNQLISLEGGPEYVGGGMNCDRNQLTSLEGAPKRVDGWQFNCADNQLTSLDNFPEYVDGLVDVRENPGNFTEEDVRAVCDVSGDVYTDEED